MPAYIKVDLVKEDLMEAYKRRPAYQQNDYIVWITSAKHPETVQRRLNQMLDELVAGDAYMKMPYKEALETDPQQPPI